MGPGLEHEPFVLLMPADLNRDSQLEGHVEARRAAAQLYPREIMDRNRAAPQQILNPIEPALRARNLNHAAGPQPEPTQPSDGRQIEGCIPPIEGDVQKDFGSGSGSAQRAWLTRAGRDAVLRAALRRGFTTVPRPLAPATVALYFTKNFSTSREILRWVAADRLKTRAVSARVGHLLVRRMRRRAMSSRYSAGRWAVKRIGKDTARC
jgi:hypothetical protein